MSYQSRRERKKQANRRLLILIIFALLFYFAFNLGKSKSQGNLSYCNSELQLAQDKIENMQQAETQLQKNIEKLQIERTLLADKYRALAKSENVLTLFNEINAKLDSGMDISRISRVVGELKTDRKCTKEVQKRFIVKTPLYKGDIKNTNVSFSDGVFDVTADGYSFINEDKKPESWFDEEKPISLSFITEEGTEVVKQALPIEKSIILDNKEYFFTIIKSESRGFVNISEHSCNYP